MYVDPFNPDEDDYEGEHEGYGSEFESDEEDPDNPEDPVGPNEEETHVENVILSGEEIDPKSIQFKEVMALVRNLCPNAVLSPPSQSFERCETEGIFVQSDDSP